VVAERRQAPARIIRTGWSEPERSSAARGPIEAGPREHHRALPGDLPRGRYRQRGLPAAVTLLVAVLLALPWLVNHGEGPEEVVRAYLSALVAADADGLRPHLAASAGAFDLAIAPVIARSTTDRIRSFALEEVEVRGMDAAVTATLVSAVEARTVRFTLHGSSAGPLGPVRWRLDPVRLPELDLALPVGTSRLLINGVEVPVPEVTWRSGLLTPRLLVLRVLPGTYRIAVPTGGRPVVAPPVTLRAPLHEEIWHSGRVEVGVDLAPSGVAAANALLRDELAACTRSTLPQPSGCPFGVDLADSVRGQWEILTPPRVRYVRAFGGAFDFSGRGLVAAFTERTGPGAEPGRVHPVRHDIAASVEHRSGRYELAAWRFTRVELPEGRHGP
jgi:hypothetical protein